MRNNWTLKETIYKEDGDTTITEKDFNNKTSIVKCLKRQAPITGHVINELTKNHEVYFEYGGFKRKFEIFEDKG